MAAMVICTAAPTAAAVVPTSITGTANLGAQASIVLSGGSKLQLGSGQDAVKAVSSAGSCADSAAGAAEVTDLNLDTSSVPSIGVGTSIDGETRYSSAAYLKGSHVSGCSGRNEICGTYQDKDPCREAKTLVDCMAFCSADASCISIEWSETDGNGPECQMSTSCTYALVTKTDAEWQVQPCGACLPGVIS